jgi:hypothetical protein
MVALKSLLAAKRLPYHRKSWLTVSDAPEPELMILECCGVRFDLLRCVSRRKVSQGVDELPDLLGGVAA